MDRTRVFSLFLLLLTLISAAEQQNSTAKSDGFVAMANVVAKPKSNSVEELPPTVANVSSSVTKKPDILAVFQKLQSRSRHLIDRALKEALPMIIQSEASRSLSGTCMASLLKFVFALRNMEHWTIQMLDASGKIPLGLLRGTRASFGDYDECLELAVGEGAEGKEPDGHNFVGQYCSVDIRPPAVDIGDTEKLQEIVRTFAGSSGVVQDVGLSNPIKFFNSIHVRIGICVPSSCTLEDMRTIFTEVSQAVMMKVEIKRCEVKESEMVLEPHHFLAGAYIFPVAALTVLATILDGIPRLIRSFRKDQHDVKKQKNQGRLRSLVRCFSALTNGQKILSTNISDSTFGAIHGLRFLSMCWIIFGHTYSFGHYLQISGIYKAKDIKKDFLFQPILNASFSVDTFFVISGILISYSALKRLEETKGRLNLLKYYLHRYIRIAPAFMMVTCLMLMGPLVGSGPVWRDTLDPFVNNCKARWWANFFFISYLWREKDICLPYGWYLSSDMLFYVVSPLFVILLFRRPAVGLAVSALGALVSMVTVAAITVIFKQPPIPLFTSSEYTIDDYINIIFFKPYTHFAPYCIGLATGYFLYRNHLLTITARMQMLGWFFSGTACSTIIYVIYVWNAGREPQLLETILYASTSRTIWAFGISWIVVVCARGYGGAVNGFLSWKQFVPLSRMTFMAYLMHPLLMYCFMANLRTTVPFGHYFFVWLFFAHLFTSYAVGFLVSLLFEAPFIRLEKLFTSNSQTPISTHPQILSEKPMPIQHDETEPSFNLERTANTDEFSISNADSSGAECSKTGYDNKGFVCHL